MKVLSITKRIILQMFNDKRTLGLIVLAPIFLMTLIYLLLGDSNYTPSVLTYNIASPITDQLSKQDLELLQVNDLEKGKQEVKDQNADALFYISDGSLYLLFESKDSVLTGKVVKEIQGAMSETSGLKNELVTELYYKCLLQDR